MQGMAEFPSDKSDAARVCASCGRGRPSGAYSRRQWVLGEGQSQCSKCFCKRDDVLMRYPVALRNSSSAATFSVEALRNPFAQGVFRYVALGQYTHGIRAGQPCVCKWFKPEFRGLHEHAELHYRFDVKAVNMGLRILREWRMRCMLPEKPIQMTSPEVWSFDEAAPDSWAGRKVLQEPYIAGFTKWNSNCGWVNTSDPTSRVMQALSHFSYHISGGQVLLCDLQGGLCRNGSLVLTDPVILSVGEEFGLTDLGRKGIASFFATHKCNEFCNEQSWLVPRSRRAYYPVERSTTLCFAPQVNTRLENTRGYM
jgi:Alpha-kinase family